MSCLRWRNFFWDRKDGIRLRSIVDTCTGEHTNISFVSISYLTIYHSINFIRHISFIAAHLPRNRSVCVREYISCVRPHELSMRTADYWVCVWVLLLQCAGKYGVSFHLKLYFQFPVFFFCSFNNKIESNNDGKWNIVVPSSWFVLLRFSLSFSSSCRWWPSLTMHVD